MLQREVEIGKQHATELLAKSLGGWPLLPQLTLCPVCGMRSLLSVAISDFYSRTWKKNIDTQLYVSRVVLL